MVGTDTFLASFFTVSLEKPALRFPGLGRASGFLPDPYNKAQHEILYKTVIGMSTLLRQVKECKPIFPKFQQPLLAHPAQLLG